ncbi:MAG: hypothetical protein V3S73_07395 [Gammaproteobacteria bacterium]|nr:hypothetical protein [Gammaproteobacteria bacterium]
MSWEKGNALAAHGSEPDQRSCPHEIHTIPMTLRPDLRASLTRIALVVSAASAAVPGTMAAMVALELGRAVASKMAPTLGTMVALELGRAVGNKMVPTVEMVTTDTTVVTAVPTEEMVTTDTIVVTAVNSLVSMVAESHVAKANMDTCMVPEGAMDAGAARIAGRGEDD